MLADYAKMTGRNVLVYCRGKFHLPLFEPLARTNPDVSFYVQTPLLPKADFLSSPLGQLPNAHFVGSFDELKYKFDSFGAFITTDAQSANAHWYSLRTVRLMKRLGVPVFEMQHGFFQLGLHYYDVPGSATFCGDSLPSRSYADRILAYYSVPGSPTPLVVIGYPPFDGTARQTVAPAHLLVLSNLHWTTYTREERRGFYRAVYAAVEKRAGLPVVWKSHHGEYNNDDCKAWIAECAKDFPEAAKRIRFYHLDEELRDLDLSGLIDGAEQIVSSISTVLLDCEMSGKPVSVYEVPSTKCLADRLATKTSFSSAEELERLLGGGARPLKSGLLRAFDPRAFRRTLDESYHATTLSRAAFLDALFELGQPLNAELRGSVFSVQREAVSCRTKLDVVAQRLQAFGQMQTQAMAELKRRTDDLLRVQRTLQERETELAVMRRDLAARTAEAQACRVQLETARKSLEDGVRNLEAERQRHRATVAALEAERRRRFCARLHRLVVALLPYGVVCLWKRMASGCGDEVPLFYYPGWGKRVRRLVKFSLPYGLVKAHRVRKWGH